MAKSLETLVRLNRWTVDERRKNLALFLNREAQAIKAIEDHHAALVKEREVASADSVGVGCIFVNYHKVWETKLAALKTQLAQIQEQVALAREELAQAYRAQKSTEEVKKIRDAEEALERGRKETAELDEIGQNQYLSRL